MLLISNICAILSNHCVKIWDADHSKISPFLFIEATAGFIRDSLFNLAHWIFCYRYWVIAIEMEALMNYKVITERTKTLQKTFNSIVIFLDIIMPLWYCVTYAFLNVNPDQVHSNKLQIQYILALYSRGLLLMLSALFLADSIFRIKKSI